MDEDDARRLCEWLRDAPRAVAEGGAIAWMSGVSAQEVATLATARGFDVVVVTSHDPRHKLTVASTTAGLLGPRLVILDDVASLHGPDVAAALKNPRHPFVCLATESTVAPSADAVCGSAVGSRAKRAERAARRTASLQVVAADAWRPPTVEDLVRAVFASDEIVDDLESEVVDALFDVHLSFADSLDAAARVAETLSATAAFFPLERSAACSAACRSDLKPRAIKTGTCWSKGQAACARAKASRRETLGAAEEGGLSATTTRLVCDGLGALGFAALRTAAGPGPGRRSRGRAAGAARPPPRPRPVAIRRFE